jgi:cobalt-zinc-cadmium efflux system membrane fusion protein
MKLTSYIYLLSLIILAACSAKQKESTETGSGANEQTEIDLVQLSEAQIKNAAIVVGKPEMRPMHTIIKVNGVVDVPPENLVSISIPLGGYVKKTTLIPGTKVSKGTLLATLEDPQYVQLQQDYLSAKIKLEYAASDFNRQKTLNETKAASDKVYQLAKAEYDGGKITVRALAEKLKLIGINPETLNESNLSRNVNLYSPINGYVTKVNVNIGQFVNPSDVLFEITNLSDLHIRLTVFENDAANLVSGQKLTFTTNNRPNEKYTATVHLITPAINDDRSTEVHCHLNDESVRLFPGTFVNAAIESPTVNVIAVPEPAVVKWESKYYIFTEEANSQFKLLPVETGATNDGFVEIKTDLGNKNIVVANAYTILMKMKNNSEED